MLTKNTSSHGSTVQQEIFVVGKKKRFTDTVDSLGAPSMCDIDSHVKVARLRELNFSY